MDYPKVLVVGINPWVDNTGINTLINFFQDWDSNRLAHIYTRDGLPNTNICSNFFQISETNLIKNLLGRKVSVGQTVYNTPSSRSIQYDSHKKSVYRKFGNFAVLARELAWKLGSWDNKALKCFLDEFNPDVLFFPTYSSVYMNRLQNWIADYCNKPVILYASDDNFSYKSIRHTPLALIHRSWIRRHMQRLFNRCNQMMVIAPFVKREYDSLFGMDSVVMTKGVDLSQFPYTEKKIDSTIKIVYTGKLIYGRWKSLAKMAEAVAMVNHFGHSVEFEIYTTDNLSKKQIKSLSHHGTMIKGAVPLSNIPAILAQSDIVVFAESLDPKYRNLARLSLSTKITDYLRSGKCIFAIGDTGIAPIDYLRENNAAVIACSFDEIGNQLLKLIENPSKIVSYGKQAYECVKRNHNKEKQSQLLVQTIADVITRSNE